MFRREFLQLALGSAALPFLPKIDWLHNPPPNVLVLTQKVRKIVGTQNSHLRWLLMNDELPQGALARYEKIHVQEKMDRQYSIYVRSRGQDRVLHLDPKKDRVKGGHFAEVPSFEFACHHKMNDNLDELASSIAEELLRQEDAVIARLFQESFSWQPYPRKEYGSGNFFHNSFRPIEKNDLVVYNVLCSSDDVEGLKDRCMGGIKNDMPLIEANKLWTADIVPSPHVKSGFVMFLSSPDTLGVVAIRQEPFIMYDETRKRLVSWMDNGYSVINRYAGAISYALGSGWRENVWC